MHGLPSITTIRSWQITCRWCFHILPNVTNKCLPVASYLSHFFHGFPSLLRAAECYAFCSTSLVEELIVAVYRPTGSQDKIMDRLHFLLGVNSDHSPGIIWGNFMAHLGCFLSALPASDAFPGFRWLSDRSLSPYILTFYRGQKKNALIIISRWTCSLLCYLVVGGWE